jgi:hypothetical protein
MPESHNQQIISQWSFIMTIKGRFQELIIVLLLLVVFTTKAADTTTAEDSNSLSSVVNKRYHSRSEGSHPSARKLMLKKRPPTKRPNKKPTRPPSKSVRSHGVICRLPLAFLALLIFVSSLSLMQLNSSNPQMHTSQANDITDHNE